MRWLINFVCFLFCRHSFKEIPGKTLRLVHDKYACVSTTIHNHPTMTIYCEKCGYHKTFFC